MQQVNIVFMGRKRVAAKCLEYITGRPGTRVTAVLTDSHLAVSPTRDTAHSLGISILSHEEAESLAVRGELPCDLAFSVLYWRRLRGPLLFPNSRGVINFHPAILPQYKGCGGYNLAILEGRSNWGSSAHYVDENIDTGPIIDVATFDFDPQNATAVTLERQTLDMLYGQFCRVADMALASSERLPCRPNGGGQYISRAEMEAMKRISPGDDIDRKARAFFFPPYDGAYVDIAGVRCTVITQPILRQLADPGASSLFSPAHEDVGPRTEGVER